MDDTAVLASSRAACEQKMNSLLSYCDEYGMRVKDTKTKFMVINGCAADRLPIRDVARI